MPRKRWRTPLFSYDIPDINPEDRNAVRVHDLVRATLVDYDELAALPGETLKQVIEDVVISGWCACCDVKAGKRYVTDKATKQDIFLSGVRHALERAGLTATRWRKKYDLRKGESLYFRLARELAGLFDIALPKDLKLAGKRAAQVQYGVMSPTMMAAQKVELAARQRP
jgi:hypothetical protein